jgi:hypothetical protein
MKQDPSPLLPSTEKLPLLFRLNLVRFRTDSPIEANGFLESICLRGVCVTWEAHMPGNPKECRQHAANCRQLAYEASSVLGRNTLLNLADTWERLAAELESAERFIQAMQEIEPKRPIAAE